MKMIFQIMLQFLILEALIIMKRIIIINLYMLGQYIKHEWKSAIKSFSA